MKIISHIISAICVAGLMLGSCSMIGNREISNGNIKDATVKKSVKIGKFSKIEASTGIRVIFTQGKATGVAQIATTPSAEPYLKVKVSNGVLCASYDKHGKKIIGPSIIYVTSPDLQEVDLSSAASLQVKGDLDLRGNLSIDLSSAGKAVFNNVTAKNVEVDLSSSGYTEFQNLNADKLEAEISSAGKLVVKKATLTKADLEASSAAKIEVNYFNGTRVEAEASSAASISVSGMTATQTYAEASSGARVTLKGKCQYFNKETGSGGKVDISQLHVPNLPRKSDDHRHHAPTRAPGK